MLHIKPFLFRSSAHCGLKLPFHPRLAKRTLRFCNGIAGCLNLSLSDQQLRPYITNEESCSSVCDEPVGRYVVGIDTPSPTYKEPSTSMEIRSVSSVSGIDSAVTADVRRSRLLRSLVIRSFCGTWLPLTLFLLQQLNKWYSNILWLIVYPSMRNYLYSSLQ